MSIVSVAFSSAELLNHLSARAKRACTLTEHLADAFFYRKAFFQCALQPPALFALERTCFCGVATNNERLFSVRVFSKSFFSLQSNRRFCFGTCCVDCLARRVDDSLKSKSCVKKKMELQKLSNLTSKVASWHHSLGMSGFGIGCGAVRPGRVFRSVITVLVRRFRAPLLEFLLHEVVEEGNHSMVFQSILIAVVMRHVLKLKIVV